jgi:tetratricopeptide (TPR) repeat protein
MSNDKKSEKPQVTPNFEQVLYTPDRVERWLKGELTLQQLTAVSGPEMLQMAIVGFRMYEQGRYAEAKMIFQGLVTLDPQESYFLTALGAVHLAEDDLDQAKTYLDRSIAVNPKELAAFVNRGEVALRQGKVLDAARDFMKAVELDPEAKDPLTMRAKVLASAALETLESAKQAKPGAKAAAAATPARKK